jgi:hypothetical protein
VAKPADESHDTFANFICIRCEIQNHGEEEEKGAERKIRRRNFDGAGESVDIRPRRFGASWTESPDHHISDLTYIK